MRRESRAAMVAQIPRKKFAVLCINARAYSVRIGALRHQGMFGRLPIIEDKCGSAVRPNHLGPNQETALAVLPETEYIVRDDCRTSKQQSGSAHQHVHPRQFLRDR